VEDERAVVEAAAGEVREIEADLAGIAGYQNVGRSLLDRNDPCNRLVIGPFGHAGLNPICKRWRDTFHLKRYRSCLFFATLFGRVDPENFT
jgi:hypothetical protein